MPPLTRDIGLPLSLGTRMNGVQESLTIPRLDKAWVGGYREPYLKLPSKGSAFFGIVWHGWSIFSWRVG